MAVTKPTDIRPTVNPAPNRPVAKLPTAKTLMGVLSNYQRYGSKWANKAPPGFSKQTPLKTLTLQKNPSKSGAGDIENIQAYILKDNRVVFQKTGGLAGLTQYLGPVSYVSVPKGLPPGLTINPVPNAK